MNAMHSCVNAKIHRTAAVRIPDIHGYAANARRMPCAVWVWSYIKYGFGSFFPQLMNDTIAGLGEFICKIASYNLRI